MSDEQIAQKLRQKDKEIFDFIMEHYNKLLWAVIGNILGKAGSPEDIEDCITDVYIKLLENPKAYDHKKGNFKSFLVRVGKNLAIDRYRKLAREAANITREDYGVNDDGNLLRPMLTSESRETVYDALDSLKEPDREIIVRKYLFNEKVSVISEKMNMQSKEVENKLYQSKLRLRRILVSEEDF